LQLYLIKG